MADKIKLDFLITEGKDVIELTHDSHADSFSLNVNTQFSYVLDKWVEADRNEKSTIDINLSRNEVTELISYLTLQLQEHTPF